MKDFLITSREEMDKKGINNLDFIIISGDAYVDHPSFCAAIIGRVLENEGYKVGIIPQPDWKDKKSVKILGKPKLSFLVTSGNMDSMVNHYTSSKKPRSTDSYCENNEIGKRPNRAVIVYSNLIRSAYGSIPIIIGGIEASLRRFSHYDYWQDKVRRSILADSTANLLVYGMGERAIKEIALRLKEKEDISLITNIKGTCFISEDEPKDALLLPSFKEVSESKEKYAISFRTQYENQDPIKGEKLAEFCDKYYLVQNPPQMPLSQKELDEVYSIEYVRKPHPMYKGKIPALEEVEFSIAANRGCFGSCSFCALTFHQGRIVTSRSKENIINEVKTLAKQENFKGYIHDIGGPTANFRKPACKNQLKMGSCKGKTCLSPKPCPNLEVDHKEFIDILNEAKKVDKVKKVFVRSGIRFDYLLMEKDDKALRSLIKNNISGQLKIAPEHISEKTLKIMGKPKKEVYEAFRRKYEKINNELGLKQFIVPYFMSSHPGCDLNEAINLACYLKSNNLRPRQVQDFYPTPGTLSTCMYYTGLDPFTLKKVYVPKSPLAKRSQRALMQYFLPENKKIVIEALEEAGRTDLIGPTNNCLIFESRSNSSNKNNKKTNTKKNSKQNRNNNNKKKKNNNNNNKNGDNKNRTSNKKSNNKRKK